jgi:hypothetical protein
VACRKTRPRWSPIEVSTSNAMRAGRSMRLHKPPSKNQAASDLPPRYREHRSVAPCAVLGIVIESLEDE